MALFVVVADFATKNALYMCFDLQNLGQIFTREYALAGLVIENGHHHQQKFKLHTKMKILLTKCISQLINCIFFFLN